MNKFDRCPCSSKVLYHKCCQPFHQGSLPGNALLLMRSRYCAYALALADYIIDTTHPEHPDYCGNREEWKADILNFCEQTRFDQLRIIEFIDGPDDAVVSFTAYLRQADEETNFSERSFFQKKENRWLYKSGEIIAAG